MWQEALLWTAVAIAALIALWFFSVLLAAGILFARLYGRTKHRHSRRALFADFPEISVERENIICGRKKRLAAYLLRDGADKGKGLVIISHGIRDRGEGYFSEARAFLALGYQVLLYDAVGSGNSTGNSQRGLPQSAIDLHDVLCWAEGAARFHGLDFYLYGHSWGGYAVCAVFCYGTHARVKAVCSLCGFNDPGRMALESCSVLSKHFGRFIYPPVYVLQFLRFGRNANRTAVQGIRRAAGTRFLILHAEHDEVVHASGAGIYARREDLQGERVKFALVEGRGHLNAWMSDECRAKNDKLDEQYTAIVGKYGISMTAVQEARFYEKIGRQERKQLSVPDMNFFKRIDEFFREGICPNTI